MNIIMWTEPAALNLNMFQQIVQEKWTMHLWKQSNHMILKMPVRFLGNTSETAALPCLEVQIRTIAMDCWASIEHELKYKHDIANPELMQQELKHCSDQIASTDLSLSTLKELILTPNADPDANSNTSAGAEKPVASDCRGIPLG